MSPLIPRGLGELFFGAPTIAAYDRQLPTNGRMAVMPPNAETGDALFARLAAERQN